MDIQHKEIACGKRNQEHASPCFIFSAIYTVADEITSKNTQWTLNIKEIKEQLKIRSNLINVMIMKWHHIQYSTILALSTTALNLHKQQFRK